MNRFIASPKRTGVIQRLNAPGLPWIWMGGVAGVTKSYLLLSKHACLHGIQVKVGPFLCEVVGFEEPDVFLVQPWPGFSET